MGMFDHSSKTTFVRSDTDVGRVVALFSKENPTEQRLLMWSQSFEYIHCMLERV